MKTIIHRLLVLAVLGAASIAMSSCYSWDHHHRWDHHHGHDWDEHHHHHHHD